MKTPKADPYLQNDCDVLRNKLGIKNEEALNFAECEITTNKLDILSKQPLEGNFDFEHLCQLHGRIFGDIYDFAGKPRTIGIGKPEAVLGGDTVRYTEPRYISNEVESACTRMKQENWADMTLDEQSNKFAEYMTEIWKAHPFREDNTRTTVTFMCDFAESQGMPIERKLYADNSEYTRKALVLSADDPRYRKSEYIQKITKDAFKLGLEKDKTVSEPTTDANSSHTTSRKVNPVTALLNRFRKTTLDYSSPSSTCSSNAELTSSSASSKTAFGARIPI
jgi:cell filamentation protein